MDELGIRVLTEGAAQSSTEIRQVGTAAQATGQQLDTLNSKTRDTSAAQKQALESARALATSQREVGQTAQAAARDLMQGDYRGAAQNVGQLAMSNTALRAAMLGVGGVVTAVVVGIGALGVAALQGYQEQQRLNDSLLLTNNFAGLVAGQLDALGSSIANNINGKVSESRSVLAQLTATGKFTTESLTETATAVQLVARYSGQTNEAVIKNFVGMTDGAAKWAAETNASYHHLTFAQYKHIELMEKQGQKQEAFRLNSEALNAQLGGTMVTNLGTLQRSWMSVANWADKAWAAMMNVGKAETTQDRLNSVNERLAYLGSQKNPKGGSDRQGQLVAVLQANRAALEAELQQEKEIAEKRSKQAQAEAAAIAKDRETKKGGRGAVDREPENQRRLIAENAGLSPGFAADWDRLTAVYNNQKLSIEWLTDAQGKLLAKQPAMRQAAQEQAALDRAEIQEREAKVRINEQYLATLERENDTQQRTNERLREQAGQAGLTKEQIGYLKAARLDDTIAQEQANLATAEASGADARRIELMREHIQLLQDQQRLTREVTSKTQVADERRAQEDASKKYGEDVRRDIKDGTIRGLEAGKTAFGAIADSIGNVLKQRLYSAFADSVYKVFEPAINNVLSRMVMPGGGIGGGGGGGGGFLDSILGALGGGGGGGGGGGFIDAGSSALSMVAAQGRAFTGNGIPAFSKGGTFTNKIVDSPTLFKFARGTGLMGEAGPEAIMPLKRGPDGSLGVAASMGGGVAPTINIYTPAGTKAETRTRQDGNGGLQIDVIIRQLTEALADDVQAGSGPLAGAIEGRYGLKTAVN